MYDVEATESQPVRQTVGGQVIGSRFTDEIPWL